MERVKKELRIAVQAWRDGSVAGRRPASRRFEQRLALLAVGAKHRVGSGSPDAICGRFATNSGREEPTSGPPSTAGDGTHQVARHEGVGGNSGSRGGAKPER